MKEIRSEMIFFFKVGDAFDVDDGESSPILALEEWLPDPGYTSVRDMPA